MATFPKNHQDKKPAEYKPGHNPGRKCGSDIFTGTKKEIADDLARWLKPGDWVLVKGSRGMAMEDIVNDLKEGAG